MKTLIVRLFMVMVAVSLLGACATTSKVTQPQKRFFWPEEPDEPKIEWIATYFGDTDIKEKTMMTKIAGVDSSVEFARPIAVAGDGEGRFVVADQEAGQVYFFDLNKKEANPLGGAGGGITFSAPSGVAVDSEGLFYSSDTSARKVYVVDNQNKVVRVLDLSAHAISIGSLVVDRARAQLVVPDAKGSKVLYFSLTGDLLKTVDGKGYFSFPNAVAVSSDGSLFIADTFNATILHYSAEGKFVKTIGKRGDSAGYLTLVTGIAIDSEDHIYATDGRMHNVTIFDKDGNTLMVLGGQFSIASGNIARGGFLIPQGITIDKNDRIYVADSFNRRIQIFQYLNQRYLEKHPIEKAPVK